MLVDVLVEGVISIASDLDYAVQDSHRSGRVSIPRSKIQDAFGEIFRFPVLITT